ncbi:MAG: YesL family protein [Dorea sp.]
MKFNINSPVFQFIGTLADFITLNFLFLISCIPVITIGPALSALYYVTMQQAREEQGYFIRPYLAAFKTNLRSGIMMTLLYLAAGAILGFNLIFWLQLKTIAGNIALVVIILCLVLYVFSLFYVFALNARFENSIRQTIKNSLLIALSNPIPTILILLIYIIAGTLAYVSQTFRIFLLIFGFAFVAYCTSYPIIKVFKKYESE